MRIPLEKAVIPLEKLTEYLLVPRPKNDKSRYLAQAGFTLENYLDLQDAIFRIVRENDAVLDRIDQYGRHYRVDGELIGKNGSILTVITVWIVENDVDQNFRFVTLKPLLGGRG